MLRPRSYGSLSPYKRFAKEVKRSQRISDRWQKLARLDPAQLTAEQRDEFVQLDWQQLHLPRPNQLMPTRLGNILRAAEQHPLEKYGLDAIICWSRLWLLLPDAVKKDLHRHLLYQSFRWNLPADPNEERRVGRQLTEYLWRGF